ncbi:DNA cytosine methyltransferase [Vibrio fluvialis]|nr:DNA cytosine methyltransferase [Vibrio fluvialis]
MSWAYYNEIDPFAAQWLRNLIKAGHIANGIVDERSIEDVYPEELREFTQCHFFAGVGVWSLALRQAGWEDKRPVWTGSCPCQPFSAAGKSAGFADERHLWPAWFHLIQQRQPGTVFGEQVASKDGLAWLDLVQSDLEAENYTNAAFDLCAAGVGAPHIRQRLWFVAEKELANPFGIGRQRQRWAREKRVTQHCQANVLADSESERWKWLEGSPKQTGRDSSENSSSTNGFWKGVRWLDCQDGKRRPIEPSIEPLVNGATARVGRLRAYGNAINAEVAKVFISSYMDTI